jgi:hypothetical protein
MVAGQLRAQAVVEAVRPSRVGELAGVGGGRARRSWKR